MANFQFYHQIQVRYGDLDPQGHLNNAKYLTYMEQARIHYVKHLGLWQGGSFLDIGFIMAEVRVTFNAPIRFGQAVQVGVRVTRLGTKSLDMEYCLEDLQTEQEFANGSSVLVTYDYHSHRTIPIPDSWRAGIQAFESLQPEP
jgi:acyl-CoA thioester hydrolase